MSVGGTTAGAGRCADELRFAQLYERYYRPIRDFFARRVPRHAVDDAVADTFLTVWRCLEEVPAGEAALVWLYGVAYRVIGHHWRSTGRQRRLQDRLRTVGAGPLAAADESTVGGDECRLVRAALARLGDTDAEVLRLVAWEQLPIVDVAAVLGVAPEAARQRLHRARRNLARQYGRLQACPSSTAVTPLGGVS